MAVVKITPDQYREVLDREVIEQQVFWDSDFGEIRVRVNLRKAESGWGSAMPQVTFLCRKTAEETPQEFSCLWLCYNHLGIPDPQATDE